ncbi:RNA-directed DNA polymerase, eukaryota, reverse transcriptase zinc-binding domain protein [Tanacetum coccineum]
MIYPSPSQPTRWNNAIPLKININTWRAINSRLPTRKNLDARGIELHSIRCPLCDEDIETEEHIFVRCKIALDTWRDVLKWWNIINIHFNNLYDVIHLADYVLIAGKHSRFFDAVADEGTK